MAVQNPFLQPIRPASDYAEQYQAQDLRRQQLQQNALMMQESQAKMGDAADARARANAFRSQFTAGANPDDPAFQNKLFAADPTQAAAFAKSRQEATTSAANARKANAEADGDETKNRHAKANQAITDITNLDSPQAALTNLQAHLQKGDIDQQKYEAILSTLQPSLQDPSQFGGWKRNMVIGIMDAKDRIAATAPKVVMANAGGSLVPTNENADAGPVGAMAGAAPIPVTQSPDNRANNATAQRGQNMTDARVRERLDFDKAQPKGVITQTAQGPMLVDPRTAQAKPVSGPDGQTLGPKTKDIPQAIVTGYVGNDAALAKIDAAIDAVKKNPGAFGITNVLGDSIKQRTDPTGVKPRAMVSDIGSLKIHDRTGAAMSVAEAARLKPFIPTATDSSDAILTKLENLKAEYADKMDGVATYYTPEMGFKPLPGRKSGKPAAAPAAAPSAADDLHAKAEAILRGGK